MNYKGNALATCVPFCPDAEREPVDFSQLEVLLHSHYIL